MKDIAESRTTLNNSSLLALTMLINMNITSA